MAFRNAERYDERQIALRFEIFSEVFRHYAKREPSRQEEMLLMTLLEKHMRSSRRPMSSQEALQVVVETVRQYLKGPVKSACPDNS